MAAETVRVGIVGAGANTRNRHIPGFRKIEGVEIVGVVNSTSESTAKAAEEFEIPKTYDAWQKLVADPDIDAVMIGTWPNLHCDITCAALGERKHVLTEARMARTAEEAHHMLFAAQEHPDLVKQIVPSPFTLAAHQYLTELIQDGFLGELREVIVIGATDLFRDTNQELHWRQDVEISGMNILALGILHEAVLRFTPSPIRVFAQTMLFEPDRPASSRFGRSKVTVPDSLQIMTQMEGGARGLYHLSGIELFGPGHQIHLYGSQGTIKLELGAETRVLIGSDGDAELREAEIPAEKRGGWRVEEEFIGAIRGEETVEFTDFATGVKYMEFTEAATQSAKSNEPVKLPLTDLV